jgi:hypothetical protein
MDTGKAVVQDAAVQERLKFALDEPWNVLVQVLAARQEAGQVLVHARIEHEVLRSAALVGGKTGHASIFAFFSLLTRGSRIGFKANLSGGRPLATLDFR